MNAIILVIFSLFFFCLGIFFYANYLEVILGIDPKEKTPAYTRYDGVDFVPARHWLILFGHHFSSIAGAAPIIGPVIAVTIWGWGPSILWIVLGAVFIGGLHDFSALSISVKKEGNSIGDIAKDVVSYKAKIVFSLFILLTLILIVSVFAYLCAKTFIVDPCIIPPSLGLIPVAILCGILLYRFNRSYVTVTLFGLSCVFMLIVGGSFFHFSVKVSINTWIAILLIYAFFASITPVHILLQPRDYLSSFLLFFGIAVGYLGLIISYPSLHVPFLAESKESPIWPFLFVTIACGAVSGFHGLIASGTTSKQLSNQMHAKRIGYGAMIFESALSVLALLCVCAGFKEFSLLKETFHNKGPIVVFSEGFGILTAPLLKGYGSEIAVVILNAFILTTLDTATRISRYIFSELTGIKSRIFSTSAVILLAGALSFGGRWRLIWPVFGASNQLIATFTLLIITCWLVFRSKPTKLFLCISIFMLITTTYSLFLQIKDYLICKQLVLFVISVLLLIMTIFMIFEIGLAFKRFYKKSSRV